MAENTEMTTRPKGFDTSKTNAAKKGERREEDERKCCGYRRQSRVFNVQFLAGRLSGKSETGGQDWTAC